MFFESSWQITSLTNIDSIRRYALNRINAKSFTIIIHRPLRAGFLLVEFSLSIQLGEKPITIRKRTITADDIVPIQATLRGVGRDPLQAGGGQ